MHWNRIVSKLTTEEKEPDRTCKKKWEKYERNVEKAKIREWEETYCYWGRWERKREYKRKKNKNRESYIFFLSAIPVLKSGETLFIVF